MPSSWPGPYSADLLAALLREEPFFAAVAAAFLVAFFFAPISLVELVEPGAAPAADAA